MPYAGKVTVETKILAVGQWVTFTISFWTLIQFLRPEFEDFLQILSKYNLKFIYGV